MIAYMFLTSLIIHFILSLIVKMYLFNKSHKVIQEKNLNGLMKKLIEKQENFSWNVMPR